MKSTKLEIIHFLEKHFPPSLEKCEIEEVVEKGATLLWRVSGADIRPGGTISGPTMMTLADFALYVAILGEIGIVGLAVTTNMHINFLRKPTGGTDLRGVCKLMKVGKALIVGEVWIYSVDSDEPVAHVTGTYSIPPQKS
ncbi:PaaI family thioesterase [Acinetobacter silvestris]|uniref:Thioesterase n=1 Tax=Acinetobacter silvestris TaxID=1977882 RepID=A0A1Y3CJB4_9GAMM|nr:PaaI family thioesterase [Acinetobacter silvestris]OTG66544.1 thioesterase [Acinetobacter silvestris]